MPSLGMERFIGKKDVAIIPPPSSNRELVRAPRVSQMHKENNKSAQKLKSQGNEHQGVCSRGIILFTCRPSYFSEFIPVECFPPAPRRCKASERRQPAAQPEKTEKTERTENRTSLSVARFCCRWFGPQSRQRSRFQHSCAIF
jgi:hypothetical protein